MVLLEHVPQSGQGIPVANFGNFALLTGDLTYTAVRYCACIQPVPFLPSRALLCFETLTSALRRNGRPFVRLGLHYTKTRLVKMLPNCRLSLSFGLTCLMCWQSRMIINLVNLSPLTYDRSIYWREGILCPLVSKYSCRLSYFRFFLHV